jgi:hypothetical protein
LTQRRVRYRGKERRGKERRGKERRGKERRGKERRGKERRGKLRRERRGKERRGKLRRGREEWERERVQAGRCLLCCACIELDWIELCRLCALRYLVCPLLLLLTLPSLRDWSY